MTTCPRCGSKKVVLVETQYGSQLFNLGAPRGMTCKARPGKLSAAQEEARLALMGLGYRQRDILEAVKRSKEPETPGIVADVLRQKGAGK